MRILLICLCMVMGSHAAMAKSSIYRMMIGGRILELAGTRQLTDSADGEVENACLSPDGRYIVYRRKHDGDTQACILKTSLGRPTVFMSLPPNFHDKGFAGEAWTPYGAWSWSSDSRQFAMFAAFRVGSKAGSWHNCIALFNTSGVRQDCFQLRNQLMPKGELLWSPDGRKLAGAFRPNGTIPGTDLLVFDTISHTTDSLISQSPANVELLSWSADGRSLQFIVEVGGKIQLRELSLSTKEDKIIEEDFRLPRMLSPDGLLELDWGLGIIIKNRLTGEVTQLIKSKPDEILSWSPNSKMIAYQKKVVIKDESEKREQVFNTLWLAAAESNPFNHMCVALDAKDHPPTFSSDCLKMAYVSDGKLYLAEFVWKPITPYDKLDAGLPLTEKEEQEVLVDRAKAIGKGMDMYYSDWDGAYPSGAGFAEELTPYTRDKTVFFRPGTDKVAFQYFPPSNPIGFPATTVVGMFDVGYGWKVVLYADGHVQVVPK